MNWGHRLKELITRNWREKIMSLVLAFLFWFMIKAQDARNTPTYSMPPQARIPVTSSPAPPQLTPVIPPPVQLPSELEPMLSPPNSSTKPLSKPPEALGGAAGL